MGRCFNQVRRGGTGNSLLTSVKIFYRGAEKSSAVCILFSVQRASFKCQRADNGIKLGAVGRVAGGEIGGLIIIISGAVESASFHYLSLVAGRHSKIQSEISV